MKPPRDMPKQLQVLGRTIEVKLVEDLRIGDVECYGCYQGSTIQICTSKHSTHAAYHRTLMHERVHAILAISGITELLDGRTEEAICVAMESLV
jgi:hypothetical protein